MIIVPVEESLIRLCLGTYHYYFQRAWKFLKGKQQQTNKQTNKNKNKTKQRNNNLIHLNI